MLGVSVVIPCFNAAEFIRETLDSVLAQDYNGPVEVLVADDGSTDNSREIIESFGPRVVLIHKPVDSPSNAGAARNRCVTIARHPLIAFLDADDLWLNGHLKALVEIMQEQPQLGLAYDKGLLVDHKGTLIGPQFPEPHRPRVTPDELVLEQCFGTGSVVVRRAVFDTVGLFDETLKHVQDHDMWLRILEHYPAAHVPAYGFKYRMHTGQMSLKPTLWRDAAIVLDKAIRRYPYRSSSIRKRRAVLAYRNSAISFNESQYIPALLLLFKAGCLDPRRAYSEVIRNFRHYSHRRIASALSTPSLL